MATDLLSQVAAKYGAGNWNALRGGNDPLLQQMQQQYGADANWNSLRPSGAPAAAAAPQQPLSTAPATIPQPTGQPAAAPTGDLIAQMAKQFSGTSNWNALRGSNDPLAQQFAQQYGADANWNALRPSSAAAGPGAPGAQTAGAKNPQSPDYDYSWGANAGHDPYIPDAKNFDAYVKTLIDSGVSKEEAQATAESVYKAALQRAINLAEQNAYGGQQKFNDPNYWMKMWKEDPAYTWDRLMGKGAGAADAAQYGPWAGGDPNAEKPGGGGGSGVQNATQFTNGDPLKSPLLAPWDTPFNYANFSSDAKYKPPDPFAPPTAADMLTDPGYTSRLREAQQAIERSASARGTLGTGGTLKDLTQFSQDYAQNEYQDLYSRKLNEYLTSYNANLQNFQTLYGTDLNDWLTNYNKALGEYQQQYNIFEQNQAKQFNRLASLSGLGQTAAGNLGGAGQSFANNSGLLLMQGARGLGDYYTQAANARAAQQASNANIYGNLFGGLFG